MTAPKQREVVTNNSFESMTKHMGKAIDAREDVFQADREAVAELLARKPRAGATDQLAAKQRARGAAQVKEAVANNRWYMTQAIMFGVASIARSVLELIVLQRDNNAQLKRLVRKLEEKEYKL